MEQSLRIAFLGDTTLFGHGGGAYRALTRLGHVVSFIPTRTWHEVLDGRTWLFDVIRAVRAFEPDLIITWQDWRRTDEKENAVLKLVSELHAIAPMVYHSADDPHRMVTGYTPWRLYDAVWTSCDESAAFYEREGMPAYVLYPTEVDPVAYHQEPKFDYKWDIGFAIRNPYPASTWTSQLVPRMEMLERAKKFGRVAVAGITPGKEGDVPPGVVQLPFIEREQQRKFFQQCKVNLNSHLWPFHYGYLNSRVFHILASGGFQLCDAVLGIDRHFRPNEHLGLFADGDTFEEQLKFWLAHDAERERVAKAGRRHVFDHYRAEQLIGPPLDWLVERGVLKGRIAPDPCKPFLRDDWQKYERLIQTLDPERFHAVRGYQTLMIPAGGEDYMAFARALGSEWHKVRDAYRDHPWMPATGKGSDWNPLIRQHVLQTCFRLKAFPGLSGKHVIEVGGGFGSFARLQLLLDPDIGSYTIVEHPATLRLARAFLRNWTNVRFVSLSDLDSLEPHYDLFISNFCLSETTPAFRERVETIILPRCDGAFVVDGDPGQPGFDEWLQSALENRVGLMAALEYPVGRRMRQRVFAAKRIGGGVDENGGHSAPARQGAQTLRTD